VTHSVPTPAPPSPHAAKQLNLFERYLSLWVALGMLAGVALGNFAPSFVGVLRVRECGTGSQINLPIAVLIWLMIIPMMMKVDFTAIQAVGKKPKGVLVTWFLSGVI
jgi:ACR3 family arsenite transporter